MQDTQNTLNRVSEIETALASLRSELKALMPEDFYFALLVTEGEFKLSCYLLDDPGHTGDSELEADSFSGLVDQVKLIDWDTKRTQVAEELAREERV